MRRASSVQPALILAVCGGNPTPGDDDTARLSAPKVLNVYNWFDCVAEDTIARFAAETATTSSTTSKTPTRPGKL